MKAQLKKCEVPKEQREQKDIILDGRNVGYINPSQFDATQVQALVRQPLAEQSASYTVHPGCASGATPEEAIQAAIESAIENARQTIEYMTDLRTQIFPEVA